MDNQNVQFAATILTIAVTMGAGGTILVLSGWVPTIAFILATGFYTYRGPVKTRRKK